MKKKMGEAVVTEEIKKCIQQPAEGDVLGRVSYLSRISSNDKGTLHLTTKTSITSYQETRHEAQEVDITCSSANRVRRSNFNSLHLRLHLVGQGIEESRRIKKLPGSTVQYYRHF